MNIIYSYIMGLLKWLKSLCVKKHSSTTNLHVARLQDVKTQLKYAKGQEKFNLLAQKYHILAKGPMKSKGILYIMKAGEYDKCCQCPDKQPFSHEKDCPRLLTKIGITTNLDKRLQSGRTWVPGLYAYNYFMLKNYDKWERYFHAKYKAMDKHHDKEWFRLTPEDITDLIKEVDYYIID